MELVTRSVSEEITVEDLADASGYYCARNELHRSMQKVGSRQVFRFTPIFLVVIKITPTPVDTNVAEFQVVGTLAACAVLTQATLTGPESFPVLPVRR
jgi:hypothetical protein